MWALGYSVNNLTLMALTLAIGFLVDDAIVFLENVVRRAEAGESIYRATLNSAGEISFTILSMTLSLAAVFIPLAFMPGLLGRIFREFAITIIVAILASGLVSLNPDAADVFAHPGGTRNRVITRPGRSNFSAAFSNPVLRVLQSLARLVSRSRLARGAHHPDLRGRRLVFLQSSPLHPSADRRQRRRFAAFSSSRKAPRPTSNGGSRKNSIPILQAQSRRSTNISRSQGAPDWARVSSPCSFWKDASQRPDIDTVAAQLRKACSEIPGVFPTLNPQPVLQINIGATGSSFGRYTYVLSGINPERSLRRGGQTRGAD